MKGIDKSEALVRYIQFAIDNGYKGLDKYKDSPREIYEYEGEYTIIINSDGMICEENINLLQIITSRRFIEAVARGKHISEDEVYGFGGLVNEITVKQAIAIREHSEDGVSLPEFINNLLPKE